MSRRSGSKILRRSLRLRLQVELLYRAHKLGFTAEAHSLLTVFALVLQLAHVSLDVGVRIDRTMPREGDLDGDDKTIGRQWKIALLRSGLVCVVMARAFNHHN
jgi:hypothetical protein